MAIVRPGTAVALLAAAVTALVVGAAPASASSARRCLHRGEQVVARGKQLEVVRGRAVAGQAAAHRVFTCVYRDKRREALLRGADSDAQMVTLRTLRIRGAFVAFEATDNVSGVALFVAHIVSGAPRLREIDSNAYENGSGAYYSFVITGEGSIAWAGDGPNHSVGVFRCEPWGCPAASGRASAETLESVAGPPAPLPTKLKRVSGGVSWSTGGVPHTATLR